MPTLISAVSTGMIAPSTMPNPIGSTISATAKPIASDLRSV